MEVVLKAIVLERCCERHFIEDAALLAVFRALLMESIVGACCCQSQLIADVVFNVALTAPL